MASRIVLGSFAGLLLVVHPGPAAGRSKEYRPFKLFNSGFTDKVVAPGHWRVTASSQFGSRGKALEVAMYRTALLAKRAGFPYVQVVKAHLEISASGMSQTQIVKIDGVGVRSADAPLDCRNKKRNVQLCRTWPTAELVSEGGRALGHTPAEMAEDYAAVTVWDVRR